MLNIVEGQKIKSSRNITKAMWVITKGGKHNVLMFLCVCVYLWQHQPLDIRLLSGELKFQLNFKAAEFKT